MSQKKSAADALLKGASEEEREDRWNLRPRRLKECIGQQQVVESLHIAIAAAKKRGEPLDHILFFGAPGLGKTTFARIIANEMGTAFKGSSGPALERGGDLVAVLTNLEEGDILFIDEIHRLSKTVEEFLYPAMEDFRVDIIFDKGAHARVYRPSISRFTLIGATTRAGLVSSPLRQRFGLFKELTFYSEEDLLKAVKRSASILEVPVEESGAREIARRSRGTIRIANRLLRRVRDYAQVKGDGQITRELADQALRLEGVDDIGLTDLDRRLLRTIVENYAGGPVGIEALSATLQEEARTLEDMVEPFLLALGFLVRTTAGRKVTERALQHLGIEPTTDAQAKLL
ncbi:MAG: Holliday junction branch migration DNA helicase RuvB [Armatimonadetes bacterium]|nr:Holliday junction branch migration DNA helicase RuvB [Armatimonadota bacterium]NIM23420.1 Holliday junction branch migration DNA helicase RuvB [Armatimonadota bacterium]NIM67285.1 Holliday junction branch migration DNA helicase RuvB [Armatimonadota bacterium]NIM75783.1 Holliday junction branch migration DNA helicase RuvB [Armatimonadota bacterium]NIN05471.1 Holliday junction branch migration DNA helicase RuvB [Armatimonadota bacterium]